MKYKIDHDDGKMNFDSQY